MTYRELFFRANRLVDAGKITLGEYDEMTKPLDREIEPQYEAKVITRGNCMMCGKELTEGLFLCKECKAKAVQGK